MIYIMSRWNRPGISTHFAHRLSSSIYKMIGLAVCHIQPREVVHPTVVFR